ncbi:MAG: hypothetical protein SXV54_11960 [Chloroflexota bacterium]|nr:hypothetical protein [Chloroflexota bacterium]
MVRYPLLRLGAVLVLLASGLGLVWTDLATAQAPDAGVEMTVTPYLGGYVKYGEWLPLRVNLSNDGKDLTAEVRTEIAGSSGQAVYAAPAPLPSGARKEVTLYILPPTFSQEITVRLVQGDQILAEAQVGVLSHPQNAYLIGIVSSDRDAFSPLVGLAPPGRAYTNLVHISLGDLPERAEPLRSLDSLILSDVDTTSLTPAQGEALRAWVELGGRLLIGGGAGARRTLSGLPDALRPVQLGDTVELAALDGLAEFVGEPVQVPGPFLATLPAIYEGRPIISQDSQPLLVQTSLGDGWVAYLALDPAARPFDAWAGALPFWRNLLEPGSALPTNVPSDIPPRVLESEQMNYALSNLPALDLPSIRWLGLLLGLYILLVGPVNYLALRRWRRLDWAWLTIPALTLVFSVGGYGLGYRLRGSDVIINQVSIIPIRGEEGQALVRSYVGIFSPTRSDYDVRVGGDALVSPLSYDPGRWGGSPNVYGDLDVLQGDPTLVRGLGVNQWAMQSFQAETWMDADGLMIETALTIEDNQVRGAIHNGLGHPLQEMILVSGYRYARLGDLDSGEEKEIEATLQGGEVGGAPFPWALFEQSFQGSGPPPRETMLRQSVLEAYFHTNWGLPTATGSLTLLAWTDLGPLDVQVAGVRASQMQTTLVVTHLPLPVVDGRVSLPPGLVSGRLIEMEGETGGCGPTGQVYVGQGQAVLEYQLPSALRGLEPTALTIHAGSEGGPAGGLPVLSLYDWAAGEWVELEGVESGSPYNVTDPACFVNPAGGAIRLQARGDNPQGGNCYQFNLGLESELVKRGVE